MRSTQAFPSLSPQTNSPMLAKTTLACLSASSMSAGAGAVAATAGVAAAASLACSCCCISDDAARRFFRLVRNAAAFEVAVSTLPVAVVSAAVPLAQVGTWPEPLGEGLVCAVIRLSEGFASGVFMPPAPGVPSLRGSSASGCLGIETVPARVGSVGVPLSAAALRCCMYSATRCLRISGERTEVAFMEIFGSEDQALLKDRSAVRTCQT